MSTLNPADHLVTTHDHEAGHAHAAHHEIGFVKKYIFSTDHKIIGIQFLFTTLLDAVSGRGPGAGCSLATGVSVARDADRRQAAVFGAGGGHLSRVLHDAVHDARHGDDLSGDHPDSGRGVWKLPDSAADRGRRYGLPDAQHAELLVHVAGDRLLPGQLFRRRGGRGGGVDVVRHVERQSAGRPRLRIGDRPCG